MATKKEIMDIIVFLRVNNNTIPDDVIDFIKIVLFEKIDLIMESKELMIQKGIK